ncbi:MAG TPA: ROK family protein [Ktedonobacteraceae bacterium]|nr:ROK family protein [Ktedonobacteraceae bacterium]
MQHQLPPADRFLIRGINQSNLLNLIRMHAPISRPQLAALSGLSPVTVMKITGHLLDRHLIVEREYAESTGGRRAGLLEINPEGGYVIGLIPQPDSLTAVMLNLSSDLICSQRWRLALRENASQAIELIAQCVEELLAESGILRDKVIGVGFGMSGLIDAERGCCVDSWVMRWKNVEISRPLEERIGFPVFVDNDANCLAIYEKLFGQGQPYRHFLVVAIGRGVGLGIIINSDLYRGAFGGAGEFGHTVVITEGRRCDCGNLGCLETYVSESGIVRNYQEYMRATTYHLGNGLEPAAPAATLFEIGERARNGDETARAAIQRAGSLLGVSLANLINIFNPECVVLSSPDSTILTGELLLGAMQQEIGRHLFSQMGRDLRFFTVEQPGYESWARGAGSLVLRHFFGPLAHVRSERTLG